METERVPRRGFCGGGASRIPEFVQRQAGEHVTLLDGTTGRPPRSQYLYQGKWIKLPTLWWLVNGRQIPDGHCIVRTCTHKSCFKFEHLECVTTRERHRRRCAGYRLDNPSYKSGRVLIPTEGVSDRDVECMRLERDIAYSRGCWPSNSVKLMAERYKTTESFVRRVLANETRCHVAKCQHPPFDGEVLVPAIRPRVHEVDHDLSTTGGKNTTQSYDQYYDELSDNQHVSDCDDPHEGLELDACTGLEIAFMSCETGGKHIWQLFMSKYLTQTAE